MASNRFDQLTQVVSLLFTRRRIGSLLGLGVVTRPGLAGAKKKHKKHKRIKRNDFGCVNVGNFCKNDGQCCSGICSGKKGKKTCRAHDAAGCQSTEICGASCGVDCTTSSGDPEGCCLATTGASFYCSVSIACFPCQRDADCTAVCGPRAACLVCPLCSNEGGTACAGVSDSSCTVMV